MFKRNHHLFRNKATETNSGAGGKTGGTQQKQQTTQTNTTQAQSTRYSDKSGKQSQTKQTDQTTQQKNQETEQNGGAGYTDEDDSEEIGGYGVNGAAEQEAKKADSVKLNYELDLDGFDDDEAFNLKEFAAKNKLSKEVAAAVIGMKKSDKEAFTQSIESARSEHQNKVKAQKQEWFNELKKDLGGEDGQAFWPNMKKVNQFIAKNMPDTKKLLDEKKVVLPPSIVKDIYKLQESLLKNDKLVIGGEAKSDDGSEKPAWEKRYKN